MRTLLSVVLVVAACAPGEQKAGGATGDQRFVGTWAGRSYRSESDTGIPFRSVISVVADGSLRGTFYYTGVTAPPVPIRVREHTDARFVQELGPYHSVTLDKDVVGRATGALTGDSLNGTFELRPAAGGDVLLRGTFRTKKVS